MKLKPYQFVDPGRLLTETLDSHPVSDGEVLLVLVHDPCRRQEILHVTRLDEPARTEVEGYELSHLLRERVREMPVPRRGPDLVCSAVMTIVARRGPTVIGPNEATWFAGWRYSNHLTDAFTSDLTLITEHGWTDFMTGWGGHHPRLELDAH